MDLFQEIDYSISTAHLKVVLPVIAGFIGYMIYWFTQESPGLKRKLISKFGEEEGSKRLILSTKYLGALSIGVLPYLVYIIAFPDTELKHLGFALNKSTLLISLLWVLGLGGVIILIFGLNAKKSRIQDKYPEIQVKKWNRSLIFHNLLAWAVYLLGYEFFFRGLLLYPLVESIGLWPAIAVNVVMYAGVHIPKGRDEAILAVPFAIVLCLLGVVTGTIWIAFLLHLILSSTVTLAALKHNPNMTIVKRSRK